jgi:DNA-binding transcriptional LysR family regulator
MRYADLDLEGLRAFVAIAETGSFAAAGSLLGRSQSAMSINIRKLEVVQRFASSEASGSRPEPLPDLLARFRTVYPAVSVEARVVGSAALVGALAKGEIDLAIAKRDDSETRGLDQFPAGTPENTGCRPASGVAFASLPPGTELIRRTGSAGGHRPECLAKSWPLRSYASSQPHAVSS